MLDDVEIDIDFFKKYNDRFGHPAGDKCLKEVAHAIKNTAKRSVDITARTGGEEFIIFVQNMTEAELVEFAMKVRKNVADLKIAHAYAGVSEYVTVSMGLRMGYRGKIMRLTIRTRKPTELYIKRRTAAVTA